MIPPQPRRYGRRRPTQREIFARRTVALVVVLILIAVFGWVITRALGGG